MSETAIRARGVTKRYRIRTASASAMRRTGKTSRTWFTALDSIDLDVSPGEVVGLIGRNGSGKSTLLKVLSRVTAPSEGVVDVWGRIGSLLEVGTGFHHELTGRENVYLNGAILGMRRREIDAEFSNIVEFADVGPFLDTPVKRYSSGMRVRLAFAVAAHLNPEILLVDEVLAVGDAEFQARCLGKMSDVATKSGRTVVFVSHNMAAIAHLCDRTLVLDHGAVTFDGATEAAIGRYLASGAAARDQEGPGVFNVDGRHIRRVTTTDGDHPSDAYLTGQPISLLIEVHDFDEVGLPKVAVSVRNLHDEMVFLVTTRMKQVTWPKSGRVGREVIELRIPDLPLVPGNYSVDVSVVDLSDDSERDHVVHAAEIAVVGASNVFGSGYQPKATDGLVYVQHEWSRTPLEATRQC